MDVLMVAMSVIRLGWMLVDEMAVQRAFWTDTQTVAMKDDLRVSPMGFQLAEMRVDVKVLQTVCLMVALLVFVSVEMRDVVKAVRTVVLMDA